MAGKTSKLVIGIFLIMGFLIGAAAIVWVSASHYFKKGTLYATFFDESVQGLQKDSLVKYRGLTLGSVARIQVAPDDKLIEVVMRINMDPHLVASSVAQLTQIGITGLAFIDLSPIRPGDRERSPRLTFVPQYPVVLSRLSNIRQFEINLQQVMMKLEEIDLTRIGGRIEKTAAAAERALAGPRMERLMANLDSLSTGLGKTTERVNRILARGEIDRVLANADRTLNESRIAMNRLREEIGSLKLSETAGKLDRAASVVETNMRRVVGNINRVGSNLDRASASLDLLLDRLERNPSELLFSSPPPPGRSE